MVTIVEHLMDRLTGHARVTLMETERMLVLHKGRIDTILGPGEHRIKTADTLREVHNLDRVRFVSPYADVLMRDHPELAADHVVAFRAPEDGVLVIERDGVPFEVLMPDTRVLLLRDAGPWEAHEFGLGDTLELPMTLAKRLVRRGMTTHFATSEVAEGHVGLLTIDGVRKAVLEPGTYAFWRVGRHVNVRQVDMRLRVHDVTGHEILTRDKVTVRVNLTAEFRVTDPVLASTIVKDFEDSLHRAIALAFRKLIGGVTLDTLLAEKIGLGDTAMTTLRAEMAAIGIELGEVALKDVILPGDMRELLNAVVAAEKEAEANVIRRREETNATRSLLNTAKVMADNPVMLRLKELEALETIAGKVDRLTVHNGTAGLMGDIVNLRD